MPVPKPSIEDLQRGMGRYDDPTDRPWLQTLNRVDWFIGGYEKPYPVKYTYSLAMDIPPATYTTDQMKSAMQNLGLRYFSRKAQSEELEKFERSIELSLADPEKRKERLASRGGKPKSIYTYRIEFRRNPDVVAEVLSRAQGICEGCGKHAPFMRARNGDPYLEVHHIHFLSQGGYDTVENAEALCPNCHRRKHHG